MINDRNHFGGAPHRDLRPKRTGVPVEGWLHFRVNGVHEKEIEATIYRLTVLTPNGGISTDIAGAKNLAGLGGRQFQKIPYACSAKSSIYY